MMNMKLFNKLKKRRSDFKIRGWIGTSKHPGWINIKMVDKSRYRVGKEDLRAVVFGGSDWASVLEVVGSTSRRVGKVFHTASGRSFTFTIYGFEYYASKTYLQNLLTGKAEFVCLSSKVI